jgi:hypothetical protein
VVSESHGSGAKPRLFKRLQGAASLAALLAAAGAATAAGQTSTHSSSIKVGVGKDASSSPVGCRAHDALSGGFENPDFSPDSSKMFLFGFNPTGRGGDLGPLPGGPTWRTTVENRGLGSSGRGTLTVFAYCDPRPSGFDLRHTSVAIGPSSKVTVTARCPRGSEAVSGGFSDKFAGTRGKPPVFGFRSRRVRRRGWRASAFNLSDAGSSRFIVFVNCDPRRPRLRERSKTIDVSPGDPETTLIHCGKHRQAWSAGFSGSVAVPSGNGSFPYQLVRTNRRTWQASAFAEGAPATFTAHVYCGHRLRRPRRH